MILFFRTATIAAVCGMVAAPCAAQSVPPKATSPTPNQSGFFDHMESETTAVHRKHYQMLRAALSPETRRAMTALAPDILNILLLPERRHAPIATVEKPIHALIQKRFCHTSPVTLDILTLYALLETSLPDSDYFIALMAKRSKTKEWLDEYSRHANYLLMNLMDMKMTNHPSPLTQLISELVASTSDAPPALIAGIR